MDDNEIRSYFRPPTAEDMKRVNASVREYEESARRAAEARVYRVATLINIVGYGNLVELAKAVIEDVESDAYPSYCPYDCDGCHDEDCPCDRLGCAGSDCPGAK